MTYKKIIPTILGLALMAAVSGCSKETTVTELAYDSVITTTETDAQEEAVTYASMFPCELAQFRLPSSGDTVVTLITNYGNIHILMFPEAAPKAVENFVTHGKNDYYDNLIFHRVIEGFMIQGGDPDGSGRGGDSIWGDSFEDEFNEDYFPYRGALAMANSGENTNGSQFFIVQSGVTDDKSAEIDAWKTAMVDYGFKDEMIQAYEALGGTPYLFNKHTVFGQVISGMDVVDAIAATETDNGDKPKENVLIQDVLVTVIE